MKRLKNIKYILLTGALVIFLGVPYILKLKRSNLEIYPSIVMPAGASKVYKNDTIVFHSFEIYANKKGELKRVDVGDFLDPIPVPYLKHLKQSNFGFSQVSHEIKLYKPPITFIKHNRFDPAETEYLKSFYRDILKGLDFDDSLFIYREYRNEITGTTKNKTLYNEWTYNLE